MFRVTYQGTGIPIQRDAKVVNKMPTSILKEKPVWIVLWIGLCGTVTSAFHVQLDLILIQHPEGANYALQDLHTTKYKEDVHVHNKHLIYIKTVLA